MKKIFTLALAAVLATASATAAPAKKDKKQKKTCKTECCQAPVTLTSKADTLSYAAGMFTTRGLMDYVKQQFGVDSTNINEFVAGIKEGIEKQNDKKFAAHAAGLQIAQMLESRIFPNVKNDIKQTPWAIDSLKFNAGFFAGVLGDTTVMKNEAANHYFETTMQAAKKQAEEAYKAENEQWLKQNATKPGVKTLPSGLQYKVLVEGKGAVADKDDEVTVRYAGHTIDGNEFDSSYKRNPNTTTFRPNQVIKGWTEALCMMPEGSKWELYIPQDIAYGARKAGQIKPYSTLVFTVEVVKVEKKAQSEAAADKKADVKKGVPAKCVLPAKKVIPGKKITLAKKVMKK